MALDEPTTTTFAELIEQGALEIGDGYRAKNSELGGDGLIFLRAGHVTDSHIDFDGVERFFAHLEPRVRSKLSRPGDTIVTTKGNSTGRTSFVKEWMPPFVYSPHLSYWRSLDHGVIEPGFLRYWSRAPEFTAQLAGMKASTDMAPYLSLVDQKRLQISLPPVSEQRAIAHILGTLDDKVELNRQMSETLEAIARALFKSWFVDFEPARAKLEGRWRRSESLPSPPAHLFDLFPDRLVDSELGEIPEGWAVKPIGELAEVVGGTTPRTGRPEYWDGGGHHWVTPRDLSGLSMPALLDTERKITDAGLAQISSGLLPRGTVLLSSRAPIGYLAITEVPVAINQGFIAMKPRQNTSNLYLLRWASAAHEEIVSHANGSTFLEISKANFRPIPVVVPSGAVMGAFDRLMRPLYGKVVEHERESRTLAALRDTLLPRLISGELRVRDARRFIGRVE